MSQTRQRWLILLLLVAADLWVFWPVRHHDFVDYDDGVYVTENPHLRAGLGREGLAWAFLSPHDGNWLPLTWSSLLLDYELHGLDPGGYHVTNLALHTAGTLVLFHVLAMLTAAPWRSAFVAGVFAVHPLHVESVAWVAERKDVLSGLFWMLTLWAYVGYARHASAARYLLVLSCFGLGLMAKAVLVTLPAVLLLLDFWPLRRLAAKGGPGWGRLLIEKLPLLLLALAASFVTVLAQRSAGALADLERLPLDERVQNALLAYAGYLRRAFWPQGLAVFYPHPLRAGASWPSVASGLLLLGLSALALWRARRQPYLLLGWGWFGVTLLPMIGIVQVGLQSMADRYTYIPLIGIALALAWGGWDVLARWRTGRVVAAALGVAALVALALAARQQVHTWRNTETLFAHALAVTRDNYVAHKVLGEAALREGRLEQAVAHLSESVRIQPRWYAVRAKLAEALREQGRLDLAIAHYAQAVERNAVDPLLRARYGEALLAGGRHWPAVRELSHALRLEPGEERATIHALLADAYARLERPETALRHYEKALRLDPTAAQTRANLVLLLLSLERVAEARDQLEQALAAQPDSPALHLLRGDLARRQNDRVGARRHYTEALRLRPGWSAAANNLAWVLVSDPARRAPDVAEALRLAELAAAASDRADPAVLDTLALCYEAAGRLAEARDVLREALARARAQQDAALVETLLRRRAALGSEASIAPDGSR